MISKRYFAQLFPYFCLFTLIGLLIIRVLIVNSKGTDIGGIEQNVVYSTQVLMDQGNLYFNPADAPFSITQYTPLYYYLCGVTAEITGHGADDIQSLYVIGRSWNVVFNLITALLVFSISRLFNLSKNKSYILFLLSFAMLFSHNFAMRPDSLTDTFCMASIYCFFLYYKRQDEGKEATVLLLLTVLLSALAIFTKQSGIQLIVIFAGISFLFKDWKTFIKLILSAVLIYSGFLLFFNQLYSSFYLNVVGGIANGINLVNFFRVLKHPAIILSLWPILFVTVWILIKRNNVFNGPKQKRILAICVLGTLIFAMVTLLKMGSTAQYFVLFMNLALIMIMHWIQNTPINHSGTVVQRNLPHIFYGFLLLIIVMYGLYDLKAIYNNDYDTHLVNQRKASIQVADYIKNDQPKDQAFYIISNLSTDSSLPSRQALNNIFYRNALIPQMDILVYSTGPSKVIGYKKIEEMLNNGEVKYIIESNPKASFKLLENLESIKKSKFELIKQFDGYLIYKLLPNN